MHNSRLLLYPLLLWVSKISRYPSHSSSASFSLPPPLSP
uniref:Uncharacterized protein n=1 Tax=Anguilla anguilla TaxID=7936 RepID=A0A0E9QWM0_ANGAN